MLENGQSIGNSRCSKTVKKIKRFFKTRFWFYPSSPKSNINDKDFEAMDFLFIGNGKEFIKRMVSIHFGLKQDLNKKNF